MPRFTSVRITIDRRRAASFSRPPVSGLAPFGPAGSSCCSVESDIGPAIRQARRYKPGRMHQELLARERAGCPIRVAVLGAGGSMGRGLALQCAITPGLRMVAAIDLDVSGAEQSAALQDRPRVLTRSAAETRAALKAGKTVVTSQAADVLAEGRDAVD